MTGLTDEPTWLLEEIMISRSTKVGVTVEVTVPDIFVLSAFDKAKPITRQAMGKKLDVITELVARYLVTSFVSAEAAERGLDLLVEDLSSLHYRLQQYLATEPPATD
jgi:hypothetical protein